jgi:flagellar biosynthesis/type III secretory pathway M-ring protein FliF/YscJ
MCLGATLSISPESFIIGGFLLNLVAVWIAAITFKRSIQKDNQEVLDKKADEEDLRKLEKDMGNKIECYEIGNNENHRELKSEIVLSEKRSREDYHRGIDQLANLINQRFEDQGALIRDLVKRK